MDEIYINIFYVLLCYKIGDSISTVTKPVRDVGEKIKEYVPNITETEIAKKVSKSVSDAESIIMENTNIYQYGGFKSKTDREKSKDKLLTSIEENSKLEKSQNIENPK